MSTYVEYNAENSLVWRNAIFSLLDTLYSSGNIIILAAVLSQVFEYAIYCVPRDCVKPFNVKDLRYYGLDYEYTNMYQNLMHVRHAYTHKLYTIYGMQYVILEILRSAEFADLLQRVFADDYFKFEELLNTYSRWLCK